MSRRPVVIPQDGFRRIAVLRLSSLGDVILTLPVVHALHRAWPQARIEYWTHEEYADVVRFDPAVAHVRRLERDARRPEDLHGNVRSRVLTFRQRAPVLRSASFRLLRSRWVHARWTRPRPLPSALARYATALAPIGVPAEGAPEVAAGEEAGRWAAEWLAAWNHAGAGIGANTSPARPVALCPGARHATKRWPEAHWLALDDALARAGALRLYFSLPS